MTSGDTNGLSLHIDTESYDHGFVASAGAGVSLVVHHHGDQPVLGSGTIKLMVCNHTKLYLPILKSSNKLVWIKQASASLVNCPKNKI